MSRPNGESRSDRLRCCSRCVAHVLAETDMWLVSRTPWLDGFVQSPEVPVESTKKKHQSDESRNRARHVSHRSDTKAPITSRRGLGCGGRSRDRVRSVRRNCAGATAVSQSAGCTSSVGRGGIRPGRPTGGGQWITQVGSAAGEPQSVA